MRLEALRKTRKIRLGALENGWETYRTATLTHPPAHNAQDADPGKSGGAPRDTQSLEMKFNDGIAAIAEEVSLTQPMLKKQTIHVFTLVNPSH